MRFATCPVCLRPRITVMLHTKDQVTIWVIRSHRDASTAVPLHQRKEKARCLGSSTRVPAVKMDALK